MNDFGKFYYSAISYLDGRDLYGPTPATLLSVNKFEKKQFYNLNPPFFHLLILPLALLPPIPAWAVWMIANLLCLLFSISLISKELKFTLNPWQMRLAFMCILGFSGTGAFFITGQLSFLFMLPFTMAWIEARNSNWQKAGFYLGLCISLKLFMLIFLPYLILKRQFRSVAIVLATIFLIFLLGVAFFGWGIHISWLKSLSTVDWEWASMNASLKGFLTRALGPSPNFEPVLSMYSLIQPLWLILAFIIGLGTMTFSIWGSSKFAVDRSFAILFIGSQIISPLGWIYYLFLAVGPITALILSWSQGNLDGVCAVQANKIKIYFLITALLLLFLPVPYTTTFQPHPWATILPGSAYFFAILGIWIYLAIDWFQAEVMSVKTNIQ
jgi:hypothetical protein